MVKLEEVLDEEFSRAQVGPEEDDWDTDSGSITHLLPLPHPLISPSVH